MRDWILKYWIEVLFGIMFSGFTGFCYYVRRKFNEQKALKLGMQALLRDRIIAIYDKWIEKGYIPIYAMDNALKMFEPYKNLDGNGTVKDLVDELRELPHSLPKQEN